MEKDYKGKKVLLVDDDPDILDIVGFNLKKEGFIVESAETGKEALKIVTKFHPDVMVLDVMMPEMDGMELCEELRRMGQFEDTPIAFLTARNEDYSQIAGFEAGADDYIAKPIKPKVLVTRIKALIRRTSYSPNAQSPAPPNVGIHLDRESFLVFRNGEEINLPKKEFELLELLLSKPGKVFNREVILNLVWGTDVVVGDRTIDVHIRKLREKIGNNFIKTVKGVGYKIDLNEND
ncbi:MAG: two-component system alkaline phosphatase synthesis response regulator PhoP [Sphingobacteriales bacterium]|jgi:two-component system alkaline phosphatase synthesis response regulator PhoP